MQLCKTFNELNQILWFYYIMKTVTIMVFPSFDAVLAKFNLRQNKLVPLHARKAYCGSGDIPPFINDLANRWDSLSASGCSRFTSGTEGKIPIEYEPRCVPKLFWILLEKTQISVCCRRSKEIESMQPNFVEFTPTVSVIPKPFTLFQTHCL